MYTYTMKTTLIVTTVAVAAYLWWINKPSLPKERPIRVHHATVQSGTGQMDLLEPRTTLAPVDMEAYKFIDRDVTEAILNINREAALRDDCDARFVVQDLPLLVGSVYSKSLTSEESRKCANIAVDALNVALGARDRLSVVYTDAGVKVAPSQHIMVPFLYYDVKSNSSAKLVVTLGQLVQDECDTGKPKHAIQQIAPYNTVESHWN